MGYLETKAGAAVGKGSTAAVGKGSTISEKLGGGSPSAFGSGNLTGLLPSLEDFATRSRGSGGLGTAGLTAAELDAARWWLGTVLPRVAARWGRRVSVNSFVRTVEISGSRRGQEETGPHGRRSARPGNALDISVDGIAPRQVVLGLERDFPGTGTIAAKLDGNDHAHLTRQRHSPSAFVGVGTEYTKLDGSTGVHAIDVPAALRAGEGMGNGGAPGGSPGGDGGPIIIQLPGGGNMSAVALLVLLVTVVLVLVILLR